MAPLPAPTAPIISLASPGSNASSDPNKILFHLDIPVDFSIISSPQLIEIQPVSTTDDPSYGEVFLIIFVALIVGWCMIVMLIKMSMMAFDSKYRKEVMGKVKDRIRSLVRAVAAKLRVLVHALATKLEPAEPKPEADVEMSAGESRVIYDRGHDQEPQYYYRGCNPQTESESSLERATESIGIESTTQGQRVDQP